MLKKLLTPRIYGEISYGGYLDKVEEIRISANKSVRVYSRGVCVNLLTVDQCDVDIIYENAIRGSLYAVNDDVKRGFITFDGGIRIGLCGEGVYECGEMQTMKNINSLVIRVPHNVYGIADELKSVIKKDGVIKNTILVAKPFSGKTTLLRELARVFSANNKVVIIDEKNELSATTKGVSYLDVGESNVLVGINKTDGVEFAIRNLSPEVLVTDEIYGERAEDGIKRCIEGGVSVFTSIHSSSLSDRIKNLFSVRVYLSDDPPGRILRIEE